MSGMSNDPFSAVPTTETWGLGLDLSSSLTLDLAGLFPQTAFFDHDAVGKLGISDQASMFLDWREKLPKTCRRAGRSHLRMLALMASGLGSITCGERSRHVFSTRLCSAQSAEDTVPS